MVKIGAKTVLYYEYCQTIMRKLLFTVTFGLLLILTACSPSLTQDEKELVEFLTNQDVPREKAVERVQKLNDSTVQMAAGLISNGEFDWQSAITQGNLKEQQKRKSLPTVGITHSCHLATNPSSQELRGLEIRLKGCTESPSEECEAKIGLDGTVNVTVLSLIEESEDNSEYKTYSSIFQGGPVLQNVGPVDEVMSLNRNAEGMLSEPYYGLTITEEDLPDKSVFRGAAYLTVDEEEDEYGRRYANIPVIARIEYTEDGETFLSYDEVSPFECGDVPVNLNTEEKLQTYKNATGITLEDINAQVDSDNIDVNLQYSTSENIMGTVVEAQGTIQNNLNRSIDKLKLLIQFTDNQGRVAGSDEIILFEETNIIGDEPPEQDTLEPGESYELDTALSSPKAEWNQASFSINGVLLDS